MEFGKRLKIFRVMKHKTQEQMADDLHLTAKTLSAYERDYTEPNIETLKDMALYFNVSLDDLIGIKWEEKPEFNDQYYFALYGETKDLTDDEKQDILDIVKQAKKLMKK